MKLHLLPVLACPACEGDIAYESLERQPRDGEEIESGMLKCVRCAQEYPIIDGIPRLFPAEELDARVRKTRESFGWEWLRYPGSRPEDRDLFLEETQLGADQWRDRFVLDAGCGMGRYTKVALSLGAEVLSFDLSDSILRLIPEARKNPRLHLVQGNLLAPPFKPGRFDTIYSQGVIHHTADTRGAFDEISRLVKRDGHLSVWVYGTPGSYRSFSTNPLRSGRRWLGRVLPLVWLAVWARQLLSDAVRAVTTRMPVRLLYALCYPLTLLGAVPVVKYLTFSVEPDFGVRLTENFDWLAPPFQTKHTKEEVRGWFESAGYEVLRHLPHGVVPKIGILGIKKQG
ncbi:MAG: methyltransferase domain-containing protein [Elusimicrobiota bacterium]